MRKVLIVTYYWPPAGGPGVQRILKFAKYLPEQGWEVVILTVKNGNYPAIDTTLINDIPAKTKVYRTKILEPFELYKKFSGLRKEDKIPVAILAGKKLNRKQKFMHWIRSNLFIPDAKIGWINYAVKGGMNIIKTEKPDLILSSSPPPTVHLIAQKLSTKTNIPWLADFRDPWTGIHYYHNLKRSGFASGKDERLERKVLKDANLILSASSAFADLLKLPENKKAEIITNGFDVKLKKPIRSDKFEILYIGGLTTNRYYPSFFKAVANLIKKNSEFANLSTITIAGSVNMEILAEIKKNIPAGYFNFLGYVSHTTAEEMMQKSALNLLFMEKAKNYSGHIPGKIFEYLAAQKSILGIGDPQGDSSEILEKSGLGKMYSSQSDWEEIIQNYFYSWKAKEDVTADLGYIEQFHREKLTRKLAGIMDKML